MGVTTTTASAATYVPIETHTLVSAASSITFGTGGTIPSTYTDLVLISNQILTGGPVNVLVTVNGDTGNNYSGTYVGGDGTSAFSGRGTGNAAFLPTYMSTTINTTIHYFMNYTNTNIYKTILARSSTTNTNTLAYVGLWRNTAAISSITLTPNAGNNFAANSQFTIYGIKAA